MGASTKGNILTTRNTVRVFLLGLMVANTMAPGKMVSRMV